MERHLTDASGRVRPTRRLPAAVILLVSAGLALAGCAASADGGAGSGPDATPVKGGVLHYRAAGGGKSIDPAAATGYGLTVPLRALVDSLVFNNQDGSFAPWLATKWEVNDNATRYTFTLREDVTFSNGEKLDAAAVKASYQALRDNGAKYAVANQWIGALKEITTPSPYTVVFDFSKPNSSFLQASSSSVLGIVAPATSALPFEKRQEGLGIIGSGAFVAAESRGEEGYTLTRREDYRWPPAPAKNQGPAHLDKIEVRNIQDNSIAAAELRAGGLDLLHNTEPADKTEFASSSEITIRRDPLPGSALGFAANLKVPGLDDVKVRRALSLAIDRDAVLKRASAIDVAPKSAYTASNPYAPDQSDKIRTDVAEAKKLLDEAGWKPGANGVREKNGDKLSFTLVYSPSTISHEPNIAVVQSQWKDIGVELKFGSLTQAELNQRVLSGNYSFTWGSGTRPDADVLRSTYGGKDPELDRIFDEILAQPDFEARKALAAKASEIVLTEAYYLPLYDFIQPLAYRNSTHLPLFEATHVPWLGDAWVDQQ
ncbi:peptide/nickel transport system substrate-binding protein [Lentzea fradiae]|uniref:Peptide/nickel transport system substrate-binding protein n=1 Tax=Lentzea fradiae TaxID=200378 RepID=A0A1G7KEM7_9PSEU|nr:ABC transporter substrate-binding protein [Lentzea fradiae]SDF35521.1 peptide/nickel transport system substrate-binding protein [Lentzea fradiae]